MVKNILIVLVLSILLLAGCKNNEALDYFDYDTWISDPNGCKGKRLALLKSLETQLESLKKLNQNEVKELLGKPDKNELYRRSQKFFVYQIGPGKECKSAISKSPTPYLSNRFNAMGLAKEVLIYT